MNLKAESANLRHRIAALPTLSCGRKVYSKEIKYEIKSVAQKYTSVSAAAKSFGISYITLLKWNKLKLDFIAPPRRLIVENINDEPKIENTHELNFENENTAQSEIELQFNLIEVILSNGIILRNVPFSIDSLSLLGSVQ